MFGMIRRIQKLLLPADGVNPESIDGPSDKTALDTGGEFFGDSDGTGKAFGLAHPPPAPPAADSAAGRQDASAAAAAALQ